MRPSPGATLLALAALALAACRSSGAGKPQELLVLAEDAARWIEHAAQRAEDGTRWPADPGQPETLGTSLYAGSPGVILFLLELHRATGDERYLAEARSGGAALMVDVGALAEPGLYTGLAGAGFALLELQRATRDPRERAAAKACVQRLCALARETGGGLEWNTTTDVIAGGAGIGLFLLVAARALEEPRALAVARGAGERLLELARPEPRGLSWAMDPADPRNMPNFAHGTAGIACFLARLYEETGEERYLAAARAGAEYLLSVADGQSGGCRVFHHAPGGEDLYYLGWCHGPVGTARLFWVLHRITGEAEWWTHVRRCAVAIATSGIPAETTPGFWNNAGPCCGLAGVAEFFLALHRAEGDGADLAFSRRVTRVLVERATRDELGARWIQAEHRVRPAELAAQTGWMQGAAGIGAWLVTLASFERGRDVRIRLPDEP